jgi:hypothetical protein
VPSLAEVRSGELADLAARTRTLPSVLGAGPPGGPGYQVESSVADLLHQVDWALLVSRSTLLIPALQLVVLAVYTLMLVARLLAEHRRVEVTLMRARGASARQIAALAVGEGLLLSAPSAVAAPFLAPLLVYAATATPLLGTPGLRVDLTRRGSARRDVRGEQQRAAVAVAVANQPKIILADEPTGELDTATGAEVFGALRRANRELGVTTVIVTHDPDVAGSVDRTVGIRDGRTSSEILRRRTRSADGSEQVVAEEYAELDRAGRLQLPREFTATLDMKDRVRLALETDHIGVWPDRRSDDHR